MNPGIEVDSPGGPTLEVIDPFSNTIRFCQTTAQNAVNNVDPENHGSELLTKPEDTGVTREPQGPTSR
jgi:hypothetical protein